MNYRKRISESMISSALTMSNEFTSFLRLRFFFEKKNAKN